MKKYTFICDKLVRHKDPELFQERHIDTQIRDLEIFEIVPYLKKKIREEAMEIFEGETPSQMINELIDLEEACHLLRHHLGIPEVEFQKKVQEKQLRRGTYDRWICLCAVTMDCEHPEVNHYVSQPEKYREKI